MTVPLQTQLFDAALGTQEGIHSIILPDIFSSGGSKNVFIDKFARVTQINGYTRQNASAFTTDTGASTAIVRGLIPYRGTGGGSTSRRLLVILDDGTDEWEIHASTDNGATKTFLADLGSGSVGKIPDAAQFGDDLYLTNGVIQPRVYDGSSLSSTGRTQSPTPTATEAGAVGNLVGNYRYKLVSTFADASRKAGSATSTSVLVSRKQVGLSWTADADTDVQGYEIYRTTGTGTTFYYLTTISGRTTVSYTDNISDTTILENRVLEEHGDAPPEGAYFCEPHKQRMWWLRTDTNPTRGYWSDPADPQSVYAFNYLDFSDSETVGDVITGGLGNYEGLLVVFTEKAIWTVSGTGMVIGDIVDWTKVRTNAQIGCVSHRSAARIPAGSKYADQTGQVQTTAVTSIAYFTPLGDIRLFDGDNDLIISHPVKDTLAGFNYAQRHKIHALDDFENSQVIWFFPSGSSGEPNKAVVWNYKFGVWYVWETMPFASSALVDASGDAHIMLTGEGSSSKGAFVYHFFDPDATSFDSSNIEAVWMTKTLYGVNEQGQPAISNRKRWRWVDLLFRVNQDVTLTVEWLNGASPDTAAAINSALVMPAAEDLETSDGVAILTSDGVGLLTALATAQEKVLLLTGGRYLHDEGMRMRVKTNSTNGAWSLEALQLAYQILPGLKRRDQ